MAATAKDTTWEQHALEALGEAGYRRGGASTAVVEALARHDCAVTALELEDELRHRKLSVGRASVYRALELLEELRLMQRFEAARGIASYERVNPNGHHHHHAICRRCGRMEPSRTATWSARSSRSQVRFPSRSPSTTSCCAASARAALTDG